MTTTIDFFQHYETQSNIRRAGERVEHAIHAGLMSLATSQAKAMASLGEKVDDRLVQIDDTLMHQNHQLSAIQGGLSRIHETMAMSFSSLEMRMNTIEDTLLRIEENTTNPEKARAFERFRRAASFYKNGDYDRALDAIDHAISNDGGPAFTEIPEFFILKARIHMGSPSLEAPASDYEQAYECFLQAAGNTSDTHDVGALYMAAGFCAEQGGFIPQAYDAYVNASITSPSFGAYFSAAKSALRLGKEKSAAGHLKDAFDVDWGVLMAAATDPVCIAHSDLVERILTPLARDTHKRIRSGLEAICDVVCGKSYAMLQASRKKLIQCNNRLDHDIAAFRYPKRLLCDEDQKAIRALLSSDIGLLDIRDEFRRINAQLDDFGHHLIEANLIQMHLSWRRTHEGLDEIGTAASRGKIHWKAGMPEPTTRTIPDPIPSKGWRKALGIETSEQRKRQSLIAEAVAHNKTARTTEQCDKMMRETFMPALNEVNRTACDMLDHCTLALKTFDMIMQDKEVTRRMKKRLKP